MIVAAVIVASGGGISPLTQFGGLSLLKRSVLTAQKAGAATCYVAMTDNLGILQQELAGDPRVMSRVIWGLPEAAAPSSPEQSQIWLVCPVDAVFRPALIPYLSGTMVPEQSLVIPDTEGAPLLVLATEQHARRLCRELAQDRSLREAVKLPGQDLVQGQPPQTHFLNRLSAISDVATLEHALLRSLENAKDGIVDTHLNRKFSRSITRWFLRTPVTPNQITLLAGVSSVLGALCFLPGGYVGPLLGALSLQFSGVLDCCDGEVARIKFMESPLGDTLDIVCDTIGALAIFLGIGVAVWKNGGSEHALALGGLLALGGAFSFPLVTLAEKTEEEGKRRGGWEDALMNKLLISLTSRDYSLLILASALMGQLSWFLWGAAFGSHVFWMFLAWLLFRAGRFAYIRQLWGKGEG